MFVIRLLLRFLLVPLGGFVATMVAVLVVCFAHWQRFVKLIAADPQAPEDIVLAVIFVGPAVALGLSIGALAMLMPAVIGVVISEVFALRSWLFHVGNGALASFIGWLAMQDFLRVYELYDEPSIVVAAGIVAGFAYWAVAGWTAGFWKPVFAPPPLAPTTAKPA
jgi:hypothetical protein